MSTTARRAARAGAATLRRVGARRHEGSGCGCGSGSCCARRARAGGAQFGEALYDAEQRGELPEAAALASLGCGNPTAVAELQRGRDRARPRLGRRDRRDPVGEAGRPDRHRVRARHDRRDARARAAERARGRRSKRALPEGRDRADPAPGGLGRRRHLELRDQPLDRQAGGARRDRARAEAGRADRDQRRRRRGSADARGAGRARARTSAASPARSRRASTRPGSRRPASSRSPSSSRTRSPTGCTARSSRR